MIREQEVVKDEEGPTQSPTRGVDQLVRRHGPWVAFPKEASEVVHTGNHGSYDRVRREQDRSRFFVGNRECGDDRNDSVPCALGLYIRHVQICEMAVIRVETCLTSSLSLV